MNVDGAPHLFVGPSGWSYDDWDDIVYPKGLGAARLDAIAKLFNAVEINSSFYGSPTPATTEGWAQRVASHPDFQFTAKLVRLFTHADVREWTLKGRDDFRDGLEPLRERGLLGAVLVQFPWFFDARTENRVRVRRIRKAFPDHPLVLEVRHRSWSQPNVLEEVSSLGYSLCHIDMPRSPGALEESDDVTGPIGYLRLHGRNAKTWFDKTAEVHEKYDYFYSEEEVAHLVQRAEALRARTERLFVFANNHFVGQGPANALEIASAMGQSSPVLPEGLARQFPRLERLVQAGDGGSPAEAPESSRTRDR